MALRTDSLPFTIAPATLLTLVVFAVGVSPARAAQPDESRPPLKMTFVDVTPEESAAIQDKLRAIIRQSDDIAYTESNQFLSASSDFDVTLETLRDTGSRTENREVIRRAMRAQDLESIVVYKREPDTLHLVVIGPRGRELRHFRSDVEKPQISDDQAVQALKRIFEVLVPEVRDFRGQTSSEEARATETSGAESGDGSSSEPPPDSARAEAIREHRRAYGNLQPALTASLEPTLGRRQLSLADQADFQLQHVTPLIGAGFHADAILSVVSGARAAIGATVHGSWAPFKTNFAAIDGAVGGQYFHGGIGFRYLGGLSRQFILFGEAGARYLDISLDDNEFYTGSAYLAGLGGLGLIYRISDSVQGRISAGLLPHFASQTHDGAFGESGFSLGGEGTARVNVIVSDPWIVSVFYRFQLFAPNHTNPPDHVQQVAGSDTIHTGGVGFGIDL